MNRMIISVIIPTFNEEQYISRCLASLQKQQLEHGDRLEVIVIDDSSTDQTRERIQRFEQVKLLHQHHAGPAKARNLAARHARGEILVFVDADMEFEPDFVMKLTAPIKHQHLNGTFSKEELVANWDEWVARCWNINSDLPARRRLPNDHPNVGSDFRAILTKEFKRVKGFDDIGYTDTWTLGKKLGYQPINAPDAVFYHYNPRTLSEVFKHAQWVSKRQYKLGLIGAGVALLRFSLPVSLGVGIYKSAKYREPGFGLFKLVFDGGATIGLLSLLLTGNKAK